jgi:aspartyl/glutamyl-tRNA(Asn/Gln) amidotransferase C subunit
MSDITRETITHLSSLNRLHVDTATAERLTDQLGTIVAYIGQLQTVEVSPETRSRVAMGVSHLANVLAEDVVREPEDPASLTFADAASQIPRVYAGSIQVRAVLAGQEESA